MSFFRRKRKKKGATEKQKRSFEDSIKAKAKLNLLEKRYDQIESIVFKDAQGNEITLPALELAKTQLIGSQALGEIGDRYRISKGASKGWKKLLGDYHDSYQENGPDHPMTKAVESLVFEAFVNLMNRSVRREHTDVEIVVLPPEMFMSDYMRRSERISTLEK